MRSRSFAELKARVEELPGGWVRLASSPRGRPESYAVEVNLGGAQDGFFIAGVVERLEDVESVAKQLIPGVMALACSEPAYEEGDDRTLAFSYCLACGASFLWQSEDSDCTVECCPGCIDGSVDDHRGEHHEQLLAIAEACLRQDEGRPSRQEIAEAICSVLVQMDELRGIDSTAAGG